ncbi:MFS general substrate transporter [Crassisporium funariophilum]|nr:MFS general substrate transporter [Crassisporium funariophilum]
MVELPTPNTDVPDDKESMKVLQSTTLEDEESSVYDRKAAILNNALQEVGMGRYQWGLFVVTGFGYLADNLWPVVTSLILPAVVAEFNFNPPFLKLGQNIGLLVGAAFWGVGADFWGRKISFNITLLLIGVFAIAGGGSPDYVTLSALTAVWSIGVGGNLPVDSAIFLEFVPMSHQYLLTVLSIWWAFGQLIGSLIAWPLIGNFSCSPSSVCTRQSNSGWRYFLFATGSLMVIFWGIRFFVFTLYESPKYLMGKGRDDDALDVIHKVAAYNGTTSSLVIDKLREVREGEKRSEAAGVSMGVGDAVGTVQMHLQNLGVDTSHVKSLFATRTRVYSTSLLIILWALIGLAFPLYNAFVTYYLATRGAEFGDGSTYITYRNQVILSAISVPGALLAGYTVDLPLIGRRGTLSISTLLTGTFILLSTTARNSSALLGWNCAYGFTSNVMYGVLYAVTPESFLTKDRGTGLALCACANRIFGVMSPIIALYADLTTSVPIFIAGAIFLVSGVLALLLPYETRGKATL